MTIFKHSIIAIILMKLLEYYHYSFLSILVKRILNACSYSRILNPLNKRRNKESSAPFSYAVKLVSKIFTSLDRKAGRASVILSQSLKSSIIWSLICRLKKSSGNGLLILSCIIFITGYAAGSYFGNTFNIENVLIVFGGVFFIFFIAALYDSAPRFKQYSLFYRLYLWIVN